MIEVNLSPREKENKLSNLGGFNLSMVNVKMLVVSIVILYAIEPFLIDYYDDQLSLLDKRFKNTKREQRRINSRLEELNHIKQQVEDLNKQETALSQKINVVKKIVEKRQNPFNLFKYVADNTPDDVWLIEVELDDKSLKIIGYSKNWKSIGVFLENLKSSLFFSNNLTFDKPTGISTDFKGQRVEPFEIKAEVIKFQ